MLLTSVAAAVEKLPASAFAQLPKLQSVRLSPDGEKIAGLLNAEGKTYLVTRPLGGTELTAIYSSDNKEVIMGWFRWANNERLILSARFPQYRYGVATTETRLISVRHDGTKPFNLLGKRAGRTQGWVSQFQDDVIDWLPDDPKHILIAADLDEPLVKGVYRVDVETGSRSRVRVPARKGMLEWIADRQHRVRVGVRLDETRIEVLFSDGAEGEWTVGWSFENFSDKAIAPIGFGADPNILYVSAYHEGRQAIFTVDLTDPARPLRLKYANPHYDTGADLVYSDLLGDYIGLVDSNSSSSYEFWHPDYQQFAAALDKAFPDAFNRLVGFSTDESRYLLFTSGNGRPGVYYVGDRVSGRAYPLGETYPELKPSLLVGKKVVQYKARDGVDIRGYLTLPKIASAQQLPTIVLPHGGPISRDDVDFDYWTEFLANRGYAVLQMDYRGSAGYGHEFMTAGLKQWGLQMQDDVTDGTQWLIDSGIADRNRICIVGGSYGGYAALMGAAKTPDLYRCAISFAGVSDLREQVSHARNYTSAKVVEQQIGRQWADRAQLKATSPSELAGQIKIPVLLVHGTSDRSVPFRQSEIMADALKDAGKRFEFIEQEDGDHYLSNYSHRLQMFEAMERFLASNLAPPVTAAAAAAD
jgi:dipeptidyl aminopeptidase/acylaminoacyl peptidase